MKAYTITYKEPNVDLLRGVVFEAISMQSALDAFNAWCEARNMTPMFDDIKPLSEDAQHHHDIMALFGNNTMGD